MKLELKDYAYILIIVILLNFCILSIKENKYNCGTKGGGIHPKCNMGSPKYQRMNYLR